MQYRKLGNSGLEVSVVGLGTNNFGGRIDYEQTVKVLNQTLDDGINFIDTANSYGKGLSEEFIGKALKEKRHDVIIATKVASQVGEGPNQKGASRKHIMDQIEKSLKRLQTDYIDLYQIHFPDPETPIEETLNTLNDLVHSGKVRYIGSSNFASWQLCEAVLTSQNEHLTQFVSEQPEFSMIRRKAAKDLLPFCNKYNISIIPYFPLYSGLLTGKYKRGEPAPDGTRLSTGPMAAKFLREDYFDLIDQLQNWANKRDHTIGELAISWLLAHKAVGSVIAGATKPEQVTANAKASDWELSQSEKNEVDEILKNY
jgi:aryl-alcohol dehydrogenase-like predicted oxidoreductase